MSLKNVIYGDTIDAIYQELCLKLLTEGDEVGNTLELQNVSFELSNVDKSFVTVRDTSKTYALGELLWYGAGDNSVEFISAYGKMWERLTDDGITNNSAYGEIIEGRHMFNQAKQVVKQLKEDPNSRRAKININVPNINSITTNDEPCTLTLQYLIRDGKLNATTMMRSNDVWFGLPYDVLFFTTLQKVIAEDLGIECGTYFHFVTSMHMYLRNKEDIVKAVSSTPENYELINLTRLLRPNVIYPKLKNMSKDSRKLLTERLCYDQGIEIKTCE